MTEHFGDHLIPVAEELWPRMTDFLLSVSGEAERRCDDPTSKISESDRDITRKIADLLPRSFFDALGMDHDDIKHLTDGVQMDLQHGLGAMNLVILAYHAGRLGLGSSQATVDLATLLKQAGLVGGRKRGEALKAEADEAWRRDARNMIDAIRKEKPRINQSNLAAEVAKRWPEGKPLPHDSLVKLIRSIYQAEKAKCSGT